MPSSRTGGRPAAPVLIGTSGYVYKHWRGPFYPQGLPARDELAFYARHFPTVELNNTFYRLPTREAVQGWADRAPRRFIFAVKGSRYLTHLKRLKDAGEGLGRFFSAIEPLGRRTGPILWQLPPQMKKDVARLTGFLDALPRGFRYAVEFRNGEWYCDEVWEALDARGVALCLHDLVRDVPSPFPPPGAIYYRRFHGASAKYGGRYGEDGVRAAAAEVAALARDGRPCYVYFNNDLDAAAISDARDLLHLVTSVLERQPRGEARPHP